MRRGLNKVMIMGYLGREPELRYTNASTPVVSFTVAVERQWTTSLGEARQATEWFNVVAWRELAEQGSQTLSKDDWVYIEGRLQTRSWQRADGTRHYAIELVATEIIPLDKQ